MNCPMSYNTPEQVDILSCTDKCAFFLESDNEKNPSKCAIAVIGMELSSIAMSLKIIVDLKTRH